METIRVSMLPGTLDCSRRACANQYVNLITDAGFHLNERRTGIYMAVGNGTHAAVQNMLTHKIIHGEINNLDENIDVANAVYEESIQKTTEPIMYDAVTFNQDSGYRQINRLVQYFRKDVAPKLSFPENATPEKCLERYVERIVKGFKVTGHIDITTFKSIVDTKSGKVLRPYHSQLGGYGNLAVSDGDPKPEKLIAAYLPRVNLDKSYPGTKFQKYDVDFALNEAWYIIHQLIRDVNSFKESGNPACFQANAQSMLCSPKYCRAYGTDFCKYKEGE